MPTSAVIKLLRGQSLQSADVSTLLETAQSLIEKRKALQYSDDADSPFQKSQREITSALSAAIERAGKDDVPELLRLSDQFADFYAGDRDIAVLAAERAIRLVPSSASSLALAKALNFKAAFLSADAEQQKALLERSEKSAH